MRDKDYPEMLRRFLPLLDAVVCTQASEPRSLTADELAGALCAVVREPDRDKRPIHVVADPRAALVRAGELAGPDGAVLIGGSLYLLEDLSDVIAPPA
jgi:folylpolyglutamate synthase/dihydropteroate synthase